MHISGILVHTRPGRIAQAQSQLAEIEGVEIHIGDDNGKLVITLEQPDEDSTASRFEQISHLPDVLSASMVYHHFEPDTDTNDSVEET